MRIGRPFCRLIGRSIRTLFAHRVRVALALVSVAMGTAGVLLTSALGQGAQDEVLRDIESLGTDLLIVRAAPAKRLVARREVEGLLPSLDAGDAAALADLPQIREVVPLSEGMLRAKAGNATQTTSMLGATPAFPAVRRFRIRSGRFFTEEDDREARRVAVLGARVAEALFPGEDPVGRTLRLRGVPFEILGVLEAKGAQADGADEDNQVVIPLRTALRRVFNTRWLSAILVSVRDPERMEEAESAITALMCERHGLRPGKPDDFEVQNRTRLLAAQRETVASLTLLTSGLAALALLVGGAGILALMLLSVRERTGEIGLRRAVGALPRDILLQFLAEATVLALGGWLAGSVVGALGALAVAFATEWKVGLPLGALLASLAMTLVTGLGFGAFPARKAALLPPIRALSAE
jgi:putative ABC transport system permease protein